MVEAMDASSEGGAGTIVIGLQIGEESVLEVVQCGRVKVWVGGVKVNSEFAEFRVAGSN